MHIVISRNCLCSVLGRFAAVTLFSVAGTAGLCAQQSSGTTNSLPAVDLRSVLAAPIDLTAPSDLNYSSSVGSAEMAGAEAFTLSNDSGQPPPRRKYSKPNYADEPYEQRWICEVGVLWWRRFYSAGRRHAQLRDDELEGSGGWRTPTSIRRSA